ncbi:MAG: hypothetical protein IJ867_00315 [Clostridia bacterium]|nr:hypothetical protein [Clostridia bacterium]
MNIIRISKKEYNERKKEWEELVMKRKDAICITDENGEEDVLINKQALVKILVNNEKANEFAMELTFGNETYEEVLEGIEKEMEDPNATYYEDDEFKEMLRRRFGHEF